jgi:hypothetical protein
MRDALAFCLVFVTACVAPSESSQPAPEDTSGAFEFSGADSDAPAEQIGAAEQEDAIGAIFGGIGGGLAGIVGGMFVFGPAGSVVGGLAGSAIGGWYGSQAPGNRTWPGGPGAAPPGPSNFADPGVEE